MEINAGPTDTAGIVRAAVDAGIATALDSAIGEARAGVILAAGASFTNGTIKGGGYAGIHGGSNYTGSVGGAGVYLHSGASLTNAYTGEIDGGQWNGSVVASTT